GPGRLRKEIRRSHVRAADEHHRPGQKESRPFPRRIRPIFVGRLLQTLTFRSRMFYTTFVAANAGVRQAFPEAPMKLDWRLIQTPYNRKLHGTAAANSSNTPMGLQGDLLPYALYHSPN